MDLNRGGKLYSAMLERPAGLSGQLRPKPRQLEEGGGVLARRTSWPCEQQLEGPNSVHGHSETIPPWSTQLNCFLTGPMSLGTPKWPPEIGW